METDLAITNIRNACGNIVRELMAIHPAIPALDDQETQDEIFKALHLLTTNLEIIKKRIAKLERKDDSSLL